MKLSRQDRRLLNELQRDATRNQGELAERVGMSRTSCWRRIRDFEKADLRKRCLQVVAGYPASVLKRALGYLYTKETKSSFR